MSEVPLDTYLLEVDEPVEDLVEILPERPFAPSGVQVPAELLDQLGPTLRLRRTPPALVEAGLAQRSGALTPIGQHLSRLHRSPDHRLRVDATTADGQAGHLEASFREGYAAVLATPSPLAPQPRGQRYDVDPFVDVVDAAQVPGVLAAWIGLRPAWSLATEPATFPRHYLDDRLRSPTAPPPPDADPHLRHVWNQTWTRWTLRVTAGPTVREMLRTTRTGMVEVRPAETPGDIHLDAAHSSVVWAELIRCAHACTL
ncbi:hypothetical protein J4G33_06270 [Actinotalea sp. BY-33]|uniref:Uncharacterized protein n=1 Tax=Actinotalea soli TaxID=2819234 RepID=A0A939RUJ2_9CELL|nr:hypothetical protein [Actinotalea soli]MBO1751405.1 hypothetical protein [Actinotalea soli]